MQFSLAHGFPYRRKQASDTRRKSRQTHVEEGVEERPRQALLEAHHGRLQLPAGQPASPSGTAKLGAAVAEVVGDGAAGGEPLRPSVPRQPGRGGGGGGDGARPEVAAPAPRAGGAEGGGGGERGGGRRRRREHRRRGVRVWRRENWSGGGRRGVSDERGRGKIKMGFRCVHEQMRDTAARACAVTEMWARQGSDEMGQVKQAVAWLAGAGPRRS